MVETNSRDSVPSWLTKEYLESILRKKNPKINVKSFTAVPPVAAGNNYASLILRAEAICEENGSEKVHSLIIKTVHFNEESADIITEYGAHDNEMEMYSNILPKMKALLREIGDTEKIAPEAIFVDLKYKAMIFEDLKDSGFKLADRKVGVDWEHVKIIARKHAKFHATSMVLAERGEEFKIFRKGLFSDEAHGFDPFFINICKEAGEIVAELFPEYKVFGEKLSKLSDRVIDQGIELFKKKPGQTLVLNHGDSWTANMLFKYDEKGHVIDGALIDFQICNFTSPVFDLMYFFCISTNNEVMLDSTKFYEFLRIYHQHLTSTLIALKSTTKPPTLFQLNQEYHQRNFMEIVYDTIVAIAINDNEKDSNMQMLLGTCEKAKEFRRAAVLQPRMIKILKHFLPIWDAKGLLDPLH